MHLPWKSENAPLYAFVVLALVGGFAIKNSSDTSSDRLYQTQVAGCKRGNLLRAESNRRITSHIADRDTLKTFLQTAQAARLHTFSITHDPAERKTAAEYGHLIHVLSTQVTFKPTPLVNCDTAILKP